MDYYKESMKLHIENCGKIEMRSKVLLRNCQRVWRTERRQSGRQYPVPGKGTAPADQVGEVILFADSTDRFPAH